MHACYIPRWYTRPKTVTHLGTNRARRALTLFMRRTLLTTTSRRQPQGRNFRALIFNYLFDLDKPPCQICRSRSFRLPFIMRTHTHTHTQETDYTTWTTQWWLLQSASIASSCAGNNSNGTPGKRTHRWIYERSDCSTEQGPTELAAVRSRQKSLPVLL